MSKQLAIIKNPQYGYTDGRVYLYFETYIDQCEAASQYLEVDAATKLLMEYQVSDVRYLDGRACWVEVGERTIVYSGPCLI